MKITKGIPKSVLSLIAIEIILSIVFLPLRITPNEPASLILNVVEVLLLLSFVVVAGFNIKVIRDKFLGRYSTANWIVLGLLLIIFPVSLLAGHPSSKNHAGAKLFTTQQTEAASSGFELAQNIELGTKSRIQAEKEIQDLREDIRETTHQALEASLDSKKTESEVIEEIVPTIPVSIEKWNCNPAGCSYADSSSVWTVSQNDLIFAGILSSLILVVITWVINTPSKKKW